MIKSPEGGAVRLILDLNAILNAAQLGGVDPDGSTVLDEDGKSVRVNTPLYGVERFFDYVVKDMSHFNVTPRNVVGVWDAPNSKGFRQAHLKTYKAGRSKAPQVAEALNEAREMINLRLRRVGITTCLVQAREADDVIAYLVRELRDMPNIVSTVDGDLSVLVDDNTHVWRLGQLDKNPYGEFPHKFITLYKALVGDPSDKIPGAKGFGDAAFVKLIRTFGVEGLEAFVDIIKNDKIPTLAEDVPDMKELAKVITEKEMVGISWRVASLHPDEVNTKSHPILWQAAMAQKFDPEVDVPEMKHWYATETLVTASNYEQAYRRVQAQMPVTPFVALDIETSSSEESDDWLALVRKKGSADKIDALGHNLTGMSLTFGDNCQHTIYASVDHADTDNISVDQCRELVELVPQTTHLVAHNRAFEFQVLWRTWGQKWIDNSWYGFLPNCYDTIIEASYVNENMPRGLKQRSKTYLGYEQQTYEDVTTMEGPLDALPPGGEVKAGPFTKEIAPAVLGFAEGSDEQVIVEPAEVEEGWYRKQYKMNQITGRRVLHYGCDDAICTAWLHNFHYLVMQIEHTWDVYTQVEIIPQYLTSLANLQGARMSMPRLNELEAEDKAVLEQEWRKMRDFLFERGWSGTRKPVYETVDPAAVKEACEIVLGEEFTTRKRKLDAVAADLRAAFPDNEKADLLANIALKGDAALLNKLVSDHFTGEPKINFDSPKQMQKLLYGVIGMTPRIYNKLTAKQREDDDMRAAFNALKRLNAGRKVDVTPEMREMWMSKASTDDQSVELALVKDDHLTEQEKSILVTYLKIKEITTRLKLFYVPYRSAPHWTDGRIHSQMIQCEAVTRRYSSRDPNLQQLPSRGEGIKFRTLILPHHDDAVIVSLDEAGQELRHMAEASGDEAMRSCYMGDNPKDGHSLIAVAAAPAIWGEHITYDEFMAMRKSKDEAVAARAAALRSKAKTVAFATQFGAMAPKVAITLMSTEEVAQEFIDAKDRAFPGINIWKEKQAQIDEERGYALTLLGARRHLVEGLRDDASRAERQGINFVIQSSSAEQIKLAMKEMWIKGLFSGKYDAQFIAPIHDEVVASVHRKDVVAFVREAHTCMVQKYANMVVPMESSLAIGLDFSCPVEIGSKWTDEQLQAAVDKLFEVEA